MGRTSRASSIIAAAGFLLLLGSPAWSNIDAEDQKLIDAASCAEIIEEFKNYRAAEKDVEAAIASAATGNTAFNIAGIASMATLGFGFFSWSDDSSARENLAELRAIRVALAEGARKKKCKLPR